MSAPSTSIEAWQTVASAVAWELAADAAARAAAALAAMELDVWDAISRLALAELEHATFPPSLAIPPERAPVTARGQLDMFAPKAPAEAAQAPAINPFEGPCAVCGEPGRRRQTFPPAFEAVMPPLEPTCQQHELVADWAIPLSADEATRVIRGELVRVPTFRYRAVYGSKASKIVRSASNG